MLSVIIPVFNEEKTILRVIKTVLLQPMVSEIIIVDDASTDRTQSIIESFQLQKASPFEANILKLRHKYNKGKGAAIITGVKNASNQFAIIQDADLELNPRDYQKLIKPLVLKKANFVIGNRWTRTIKAPLIIRLANFYFSLLTRILFSPGLSDPYCCYKVAPTSLWKKLKLSSRRFEIEAEIVAKVLTQGLRVIEVPITYTPRTYKQGKKIKFRDAFIGTYQLVKRRFNL